MLNSFNFRIRTLTREPIPDYENVICDFSNDRIPQVALESVDTVFHIAGLTHDTKHSAKMNYLYQKINVDVTTNLAELAVKSGVKRFVFVSSVKACISPKECCEGGGFHCQSEGIYGKTKREAELKLLEIGKKSGMFISIVRPTLIYGPGMKGNLEMMFSGIKNGWFPPLPETGNRRSMIHVDDLVQALLLVSKTDRANGEIYIATDGKHYSSREIYESMCHVLEKSVPRWSVNKLLLDILAFSSPSARSKIRKLFSDDHFSSEKLQSLGFKPHFSLRGMNETSF